MFQYALGRNLALINNTKLYLDLSDLLRREPNITHTFREFELDIFNIKYSIGGKKNYQPSVMNRVIKKFFPVKVINEKSFFFDPDILQLKGKIFLNGFWQTEQYFKSIKDTIKNDFCFKNEPNHENKTMLNIIEKSNSVSIHVRRGDYLTNCIALKFHGVCTELYYQNSIKYIRQRIKDPHFFIFSDDIDWVKDNIILQDRFTLVNINHGKKSYEDMRLMMHCKHNIIANSSFSWWAAWLNNNLNKIVTAPEKWFVEQGTDIIPDAWIKIEN